MIGNDASRPLRWAPSRCALAVTSATGTRAHSARTASSPRGCTSSSGVGAAGRGTSKIVAVVATHASPSAIQASTWTGCNTATATRKHAHPAGTAACHGKRLLTTTYPSTNAMTAITPSSVPFAASAANGRPWSSASTNRIGPAIAGRPPTTPPIRDPNRRATSVIATTKAGARTTFRTSTSTPYMVSDTFKASDTTNGSPGLLARDVDEAVAALAERGADHDLQVRRLAAVVVRRVHDARIEVHGVPGPQRRRLALDELRHLALLDDDHLLLPVVAVERMALTGLQRHVHHDELLRAGVRRPTAPPDRAPVELLLLDVGLLHERAHACTLLAQTGMDLKRRMFSVIATSVGRRSIDDAPKKPTTPSVRSITNAASSGSAIGPPWHSTRISGFTAFAASCIAWISGTHSSSVLAVDAPIAPPVVSPMCGTSTSAPARAMSAACSGSNTYGAVSRFRSCARRIMSTSRP